MRIYSIQLSEGWAGKGMRNRKNQRQRHAKSYTRSDVALAQRRQLKKQSLAPFLQVPASLLPPCARRVIAPNVW